MARFPSPTVRSERDVNDDGRVHEREAGRDPGRHRSTVLERPTTVDARGDVVAKPMVVKPVVRPRASGLATFGLVLGLLAAAGVATGVLAAPGVAVGLIGLLFSIGGVAATARRHVTGRLDALFGLLLSLAAVVVGVLALSGSVAWPNPEANQVDRLVDWLSAELPWLDRF